MDKKEICFIRAKLKDDYVFDGVRNSGYKIIIPYKDKNLLLRLLREAWYRLKLPGKRLWYNSKIKKIDAKIFIILDPLIISDLLIWVKENHPHSRIILDYENRADTTINPDDAGLFVEKWSYDKDDCENYSMNFCHPSYFDIYRTKSVDERRKKIDVLYLGRDKGRLNQILAYEKRFRDKGLTTYFHICADRSFMKFKNPIYKSIMPYTEYLRLLEQSRAILNIVREGQISITQREMEAAFDGVKCITTNKVVKSFELYHPTRYFILGEDDMENILVFLETPFLEVDEIILNNYKFETAIDNMVSFDGRME